MWVVSSSWLDLFGFQNYGDISDYPG
jgi:hypothetical protein